MHCQKPISLEGILTSLADGVFQIIISNTKKFNALTMAMYKHIGELLVYADSDPAIKLIYLSGNGDYFSAGADLSQYSSMDSFAVKNLEKSRDQIIELVDSFINFSKPIFAAVNGPAIGISFSLLALCDVIYCTENSYFSAPFISLALAPEACSSFLFPKIFGNSVGREIILFGRKIVADEAGKCGFVSKILKKEKFREVTLEKAKEFAKFDGENLISFKKLLNSDKEFLKEVNRREINFLFQQWQKGGFLNKMKKVIESNANKVKAKL